MTATDELRRLLDERGVKWRGGLPTETMVEADGLDLLYVALPDGRVRAFIRNYLTPEQAVEATLGNDGAAELQTENAKLRDELDAAKHDLSVFSEEIVAAKAENAKLRELVRIAGTYCVNGLCGKDDGCPLYLGKPYCALPDRMRDLGVEVDG